MSASAPPPALNVWYGESQILACGGSLRDWCVHGSVSPPEAVAALTASLNGGPPLRLAFDRAEARLAKKGNFIAEFPVSDFRAGTNTVTLTARDGRGRETRKHISVEKDGSNFPRHVHIDWSRVSRLQEVCNVGDGKWGLTPKGVRILEPGYDRFLCVGNPGWRDYEAESAVLLHDISGTAYCGFLMRFVEHLPLGDTQPKSGYLPLGGLCWFGTKNAEPGQLRPQLHHGMGHEINYPGVPVQTEEWQRIKARCETLRDDGANNTTRYSFKTWRDGEPEPESWNFSTEVNDIQNGSSTGLRNGCLALISYRADVTFGKLTVRPVGWEAPG